MTEQDQCARCGRPRASVLNDPLQRCRAAETQPCLWQEIQRAPRQPERTTNNDLGRQLEAMRQQLGSAQTEAAQLKQQMETITAELETAREQVTQHQAAAEQAHVVHESAQTMVSRLKAEVARLMSQQTPPDPPPLGPPGPPPNLIRRLVSWLAASRVALASIGSALGIALGAGGVAGWHVTNPTPATLSVSAMANRIQDALPQDLRGMPLGIDEVTKTVHVDQALSAKDRERVTLIIGAVHAGAGLQLPSIRFPAEPVPPHLIPPASGPIPNVRELQARINDALQRKGFDKLNARVEESSGPGGAKVVSVDGETNGPAQLARADSIIRSVFEGAGLPEPVLRRSVTVTRVPPEPIPSRSPQTPASVPTVAPPSIEEGCKLEQKPLQRFLNWKLTRCMREKCCGQPMSQNQECIAFNTQYPLNCP